MLKDLLKDLNQEQRQAVLHQGSPLLILAGAGSGKTRALTHRVAHLIVERNVSPERILLTTFTNKAAQEMQERLEKLIGARLPFAGTFHSLCARILRRHAPEIGLDRDFVIYDPADQLTTIKHAYQQLKLDPKDIKPGAVLGAISGAKNELLSPESYADIARSPFQQKVALVYKRYQNLLKEYNALDFDDLLLKTVDLLETSEHIRYHYQEQFLHVLVDEYQDTNRAQYLLTKLLSGKHQNIAVVGDASQSIYSWRGADYRNLMLLKEDFPNLTTIKLEQNYRSTQTILDAAYGVISYNSLHPILSLWTDLKGGDDIKLFAARNEYEEVNYIIEAIKNRPKSQNLSDTAVLYRTNAQSRVLEEAFIRAGMPYVLVGGLKFYERQEIKDILAYVRYAHNRKDTVSWQRLQKIGKRRFQTFDDWLGKADLSKEPTKILDEIISVTGYLDRFDQQVVEDAQRVENVQELRSVAQGFADMSSFLENVALVEQDTKSAGFVTPDAVIGTHKQDAVILMTLHASKGLEFEEVFMIGMEEGLFPHSRALMEKSELEEERRLCYVGITRAKRKLHLTYAKERVYFGSRNQNMVSRFLSEIPPEVMKSVGQGKLSTEVSNNAKPRHGGISAGDDKTLEAFLKGEIDIDEFLNS